MVYCFFIYFMKFKKYPFSGQKEILKGEYTLPEINAISNICDLIEETI